MNNYQQNQENNPDIRKVDIFTLKLILNRGEGYDAKNEKVELRLDSNKDH